MWVAPGKHELTAIADLIRESSLDWTVVRFLSLTDEPSAPAVKAEVGKVTSNRKIPRSSICAFIVRLPFGAASCPDCPIYPLKAVAARHTSCRPAVTAESASSADQAPAHRAGRRRVSSADLRAAPPFGCDGRPRFGTPMPSGLAGHTVTIAV